jgi:putative ABC transport system permease protein
MLLVIPLAWLQLKREKLRLLVATSGTAFAVILIFMQLGFQDALFESSVRYHSNLNYDVAMISPKTDFIVQPENFPRRRLIQALGVPGVASVSSVYLGQGLWRNPEKPTETRSIYVVGFDPSEEVFDLPGVKAYTDAIRLPDVLIYDRDSRPEFGRIPELLEESRARGRPGVETEIANRTVSVVGLFSLGTSFGIDASVVTSDLNFRRIFPFRKASQINLGLIRLEPGVDARVARDRIAAAIPADVEILTRDGFIEREIDYWSNATPIGYVFGFGVIIGLTVGGIIVYQILFADVSDHLQEYATLKAMGYTNGYLFKVVLQEAVILAVLGFLPGFGASLLLFEMAGQATHLPLEMTPSLAMLVLGLTVAMCAISGAVALRKVRSADPAEIF